METNDNLYMRIAGMLSDETMTIKPLELLEFLRSYQFLDRFGLVVYGRRNAQVTRLGLESHVCGDLVNSLQCGEPCRADFEKAVTFSLGRDKPVVFRCRAGLLNFAVPLFSDGSMSYCLVGGALREQSVDLTHMESLAKSGRIDASALLEKLDRLPAASLSEVKETATKVQKIVTSFRKENPYSRLLDRAMDRLNAVTAISCQLDKIGSADEAVQLLNEALGIFFDLPKIAIVLRNDGGGGFSVRAHSGLPAEFTVLPGNDITEFFLKDRGENAALTGKDMKYFFTGAECENAVCMPIQCGDELLGFLVLPDAELDQRDIRLVELLVGRLSSKLMLVRKDEEQARERAESEEKAARLEQLSMTDPLTGLFNRRFLELRLEEELNRCSRYGESFAVMFVDLDNFRVYNDLCGRDAGDDALKKTALQLKASSRQMDTVTRVAGGKFCILVPGTSRSGSIIVAERIRSKIESTGFLHEENLTPRCLTASIGVSLFQENGDTAEELLQAADMALRRAKTSGRNHVVHFTPETKDGNRVVSMHANQRQL